VTSLRFAPKAQADLADIWRYSAEHWGVNQADRYTDDIRDACSGLADGSRQGRPAEIRTGYLKYRIGAHVIYFREYERRLEVIRILHARMDVGVHL